MKFFYQYYEFISDWVYWVALSKRYSAINMPLFHQLNELKKLNKPNELYSLFFTSSHRRCFSV